MAGKVFWMLIGVDLVLGAAAGLLLGDAHGESSFLAVAQAVAHLADPQDANGEVLNGVPVEENGVGPSTVADLAAYSRQCPLDAIERFKLAKPPAGQTYITVTWACPGRDDAKEALFIVAGKRIESVSFRPTAIVRAR